MAKILCFCLFGICGAMVIGYYSFIFLRDQKKLKQFKFRKKIFKKNKKLFKLFQKSDANTLVNDNEIKFLKSRLTFLAKGEFDCKKNFNDVEGYHFGFHITGEKLTEKPKNFDDVLDYENRLFDIWLAYFDDEFLTECENDNGILFSDLDNIEGKKLSFDDDSGFVAQIHTDETEEIFDGEIEFVKWNKNERVIAFKLYIPCFLVNDVLVGKIKLEKNETFDELEKNTMKKVKDIDYTIVKDKLKKLFEKETFYTDFGDKFELGGVVGLYPENVFDKAQIGFRVDSKGFKNKEWLGNQYFVVGGYGSLGDVLVVDAENDAFPIYALQHDNWECFEKIANSFEDFSKIIELINRTDIKDDHNCIKLKKDISKIIKCDFWNDEIDIARESLS